MANRRVAHQFLHAKAKTPAEVIVAAARWALEPVRAKYHAAKLVRPGGLREIVQLYQAEANDGLDWTGVSAEDVRRYRKPGHHLTQAQVDVLKIPLAGGGAVEMLMPEAELAARPP
jgi:hypothetical protein